MTLLIALSIYLYLCGCFVMWLWYELVTEEDEYMLTGWLKWFLIATYPIVIPYTAICAVYDLATDAP